MCRFGYSLVHTYFFISLCTTETLIYHQENWQKRIIEKIKFGIKRLTCYLWFPCLNKIGVATLHNKLLLSQTSMLSYKFMQFEAQRTYRLKRWLKCSSQDYKKKKDLNIEKVLKRVYSLVKNLSKIFEIRTKNMKTKKVVIPIITNRSRKDQSVCCVH